jgi:hypothetical protein
MKSVARPCTAASSEVDVALSGGADPGQFHGMLEKGLPQIAVVITVFGVARCVASQLVTSPVTMLAIVTSVVAAG